MAIKVVIAYTADMATELRWEGVAAEDIQGMLEHRAYSGIMDIYAKYPPNIWPMLFTLLTLIWASCLPINKSNIEKILYWSGKRGSNSRPQPWQGCALPTELFPHIAHWLAIVDHISDLPSL